MKTVVILVHPNLTQSKVNAALAKGVESLPNVQVRDLYALYPDRKIDVAAEQAALEQAERIVLQFPMYWYSSPALLKQWQDDVLTYGWAYGSRGKALLGKELKVAISLGAPQSDYQKEGDMGHTVEEFLLPFEVMAKYTNMTYIKPFVTGGSLTIDDETIAQQVARYQMELAD